MATQDEILIRQYAHDELSAEEAQQLEARLQAEPELKEELEIYLALRAREAVAQKQRWQQLKAAQPAPETKEVTPLWRRPAVWLSVAAAVLALAALVWLTSRPGPDASELAGQYLAQAYPAPEIAMGAADTDSLWRAASAAYRVARYEEAAQALSQMPSLSDEQAFYLGLSYLNAQTPNYRAALPALEKAGGNYQEAATFYRALALIQLGEPDAARILLEQIREGDRGDEVRKLLQGL